MDSISGASLRPAVSAGNAPAPAPAAAAPSAAELAADVFMSLDPGADGTYGPGQGAATSAVEQAKDPDAARKETLIRDMIRRCPTEEAAQNVVGCLSAYPVQALQVVHDYGTRIEIYDFSREDVPEYLPSLADPNTLGAYNTKANVLGMDASKASKFTLLHEFAHALDGALCDVSDKPEWKGTWKLAATTNRTVRDYAKGSPSEYLAESTTAWLIADEELPTLIDQGLAAGALGMEERAYMQMNQCFSHGSLERMDPDGFQLVSDLLEHRIGEGPFHAPLPAMDETQWKAFLAEKEAREKHS